MIGMVSFMPVAMDINLNIVECRGYNWWLCEDWWKNINLNIVECRGAGLGGDDTKRGYINLNIVECRACCN